MTWDQTSARALRKMLLDDARLKAVISLPQGVFVSKSGAGPTPPPPPTPAAQLVAVGAGGIILTSLAKRCNKIA